MNKKCQQSYIDLIKALMSCSNDAELMTLTENIDLLDAGLLATVESLVEVSSQQQNEYVTNRLINLASLLRSLLTEFLEQPTSIDSDDSAKVFNNSGESYRHQGKYQEAISCYQQAIAIAVEIKDTTTQSVSLTNMGIAYCQLGQYGKAIEYQKQSLEIAQSIKDRREEARCLCCLGNSFVASGQYQYGIEHYQQSLPILREIGDRQLEFNCLYSLARAYSKQGDFTQAIDYYQQALALSQKLSHRFLESCCLKELGKIFCRLENYQQCIKYTTQCLSISQELEDVDTKADCLNLLGISFERLGENQHSLEYFQQSLAVYQEIKNHTGEANCLGNIGLCLINLGRYQEAIQYFQLALVIAEQINERYIIANCLGNLGQAYSYLGDYKKAIMYAQQQLDVVRKIDNRQGESNALLDIGIGYKNLGEYQLAIEYQEKSLVIAKEIKLRSKEANVLTSMGVVYDLINEYDRAISCYQQSLMIHHETQNLYGKAVALNNLGISYQKLGEYEKAIDYQKQSLSIHQKIGNKQGEFVALYNLGDSLLKIHKLEPAADALWAGMKVLESLRLGLEDTYNYSLFVKFPQIYGSLQKLLIAQNRANDALEISERGRARAFVDLLAQRLSLELAEKTIKSPLTIKEIQQVAIEQKSVIVEYSILNEEILVDSEFDIYHDNGNLDESKVAYNVKKQLQYLEIQLLIWVIQPSGEITFRQVNLQDLWQQHDINLSSLVMIFYDSIRRKKYHASENSRNLSPNLILEISEQMSDFYYLVQGDKDRTMESCIKTNQHLYQILIEPIVDLLPVNSNTPVIFIPQGMLFLLPFSALQDEKGKFLVEKYTIATAPSIQALQLISQNKRVEQEFIKEILVVGNPIMPSIATVTGELTQPLSPLPGSEIEATAIAKLLNTTAITGAAATKTNILERISNARIIHLATHGLLDDITEFGIPGAIALAPSDLDNGFLSAGEILQMKLKAQLAVISACDTGLGKISPDGVMGLSRCLIASGVNNLIVSLWAVNDLSTAFLMIKFYQNFNAGSTIAQALNKAQDWLRCVTKEELLDWTSQLKLAPEFAHQIEEELEWFYDGEQPYQNPYFWAAFSAI
jgi:CHAT domain-containing protein/tetratricopeptide (TPR) repeat protein